MDAKILAAILDSIGSPILFVDNDHIIQYLNKPAQVRFYEKLGYRDLIGKSVFDCHKPASNDGIKSLYGRFLAGENEIFVHIINNRTKLTAIAVRDPQGKLLGYYERYEKVTATP
ncbi:MAG: PAS domain-containing protein [Syntrophales bacterium]|jgi:DUF438 domain-containing protein|nr:PAS domain-containing protein [Syntrophales bacterium]